MRNVDQAITRLYNTVADMIREDNYAARQAYASELLDLLLNLDNDMRAEVEAQVQQLLHDEAQRGNRSDLEALADDLTTELGGYVEQ